MDVSSGACDSVVMFLPQEVLLVDTTISLHPFLVHRLDVGPIRLTTIAHAFNYRVTVLRDGVQSAARVGRSRRAAGQILEDIGLPWGHQVAVMFQIVCALALEVPSVLLDIENLHGPSPNVILSCEPWGHMDHSGGGCECLSSDSTGTYVHDLSMVTEETQSAEAREQESSVHSVDCLRSASWLAPARGTRGRCPLCLISQGLTAGYSWLCTCGGRRASWWCPIGCILLRGGGGLEGGSASHSAQCG